MSEKASEPNIHMHTHTFMHMYIHTHSHTHACTYTYTCTPCTTSLTCTQYTLLHMCMHLHTMYTHEHTHFCTYVCMHTHMHAQWSAAPGVSPFCICLVIPSFPCVTLCTCTETNVLLKEFYTQSSWPFLGLKISVSSSGK